MIYNDKHFEELLIKDNSVSIHHRNIQRLAIQMCMVTVGMPPVMSEIFQLRHPLSSETYTALYGTANSVFIMDPNLRSI